MSWKGEMRKAGYDPAIVEDATKSMILGNVLKQDLKGAVIGSPTHCCGSHAIRRETGAEWVWVGAQIAIVVFSAKKASRFTHNGGIPSMQDKGFFPINYPIRLKAPKPNGGNTREYQKSHKAKVAKGEHVPKKHTKPKGYTLVGEFRRK